ncbi:MAG: SMP-30/gluconolactonase/LRE family protein [Paracoccaceae bacterium]
MMDVLDARACTLGEGPLWHPERQQLFWFDIPEGRMLSQTHGEQEQWDFGECVSAAGWIDRDTLLIASETTLWRFNLTNGDKHHVVALEADNPVTRSNDGRADPWGGLWIGTMGKGMERDAGAIYRFYKGELRQLYAPIWVPNSICFAPDHSYALFTDTPYGKVSRQTLDPDTGWPLGEPETFIDFKPEGLNPDGAVIAADGTYWVAQWGASRVAVYDRAGQFLRAFPVDAVQSSCPAFGGPDLTTLYCTSARTGLDTDLLEKQPSNGMTFVTPTETRGQAEHRIIL